MISAKNPAKPRKRMGRPPLPAKARKGFNFTFRGREDLRKKLWDAASQSGRSISEEIESILEAHFTNQDLVTAAFGGEAASVIMRPLLFFLGQLERKGIAWRSNEEIGPLVQACISLITDAALRKEAIPYLEWKQRLWASYNRNVLVDTGPGPTVLTTATLVI